MARSSRVTPFSNPMQHAKPAARWRGAVPTPRVAIQGLGPRPGPRGAEHHSPGQGQPQQVGQRGGGSGLAAINICSPVSLALLAAGTSREAALLCTSPQLRECRATSVDFEFVVIAEDQRSVIEGDRPATRKCPVTPERTVAGNDVAVIFDDDPRRAQPWIAHQPRAPRSAGADPHAYRNPSCLLSVAARSRRAVHLPRRLLCSRAPRPGSVTRRWVFRAASRGGAGGECGRCGSARPLGRVSPQTFSNDSSCWSCPLPSAAPTSPAPRPVRILRAVMRHEDVLVATGRFAGSRRDQSPCGHTPRQLSRSAATQAVRRAGAAEYQSFRVVLRGRCPSGTRRGPALGQQPEHERRTRWAVFCRSPFWWLGPRPTSGHSWP